jgi:hypothetical protein
MNNDILEYVLRSSISMMIFYLLYWLFLKKEKTFRFNRYYLLSSIALSYMIPFVNFSNIFSRKVTAVLPGMVVQNLIIRENIIPVNTANSVAFQTTAQSFNFADLIPYIYFIILMLLLIRFILGMIKLFFMYKRGRGINMGDYTLVYTKDNIAPFSFFKYIFLNEDSIENKDLNQIIAHEYIHVKQNHTIDMLFVNILTAVQWFNPFIWMLKKSLRETHEFLADEKVIAQGFDSASYSELLIKQIAGVKAMDFANYFNHLLIKKRLIMLKKLKPGRLMLVRVIMLVPITIIMVFAFSCQEFKTRIYKDRHDITIRMQGGNCSYDSLMSISTPNVEEAFVQAWWIAEENIILPKEENNEKEYSYWLKLSGDADTGKIDFTVEKFKTPKDWFAQDWGKTVPKETIKVINYEEVKEKFPIVSAVYLEKFKLADSYKYFRKLLGLNAVAKINSFSAHLEHWGYAAN